MTDKRTHVVVIGGGYAGVTRGQPSADARRRRHHAGQPAAEVRRADPAAPVRRRAPTTPTVDYGTLLGEGIQLVVDSASASTPPRAPCTLASGGAAGLRLRHLRGRQHRRRAGIGARRGRIRLSHRRIRARAAAARRARRAAPRRAGHRRRRRADRHRDGRRAGRAGPHGHAGVRRRARPVPVASRAAGRSPSGCASSASRCSRPTSVTEVRADAVVLRRRRGAARAR